MPSRKEKKAKKEKKNDWLNPFAEADEDEPEGKYIYEKDDSEEMEYFRNKGFQEIEESDDKNEA